MKLPVFYAAPPIADAYHLEHTVNDQHGDIHCTTISERSRTTPMGVWITVPPQPPASFTASGTMTWSVPVTNQFVTYTLEGNKMTLSIILVGATVGGVAGTFLRMKIPSGFTAVSLKYSTGLVSDNTAGAGTGTTIFMRALPNTTNVEFFRTDLANFTLSAANTNILGQIALEVR
jgi:hypothetical protein